MAEGKRIGMEALEPPAAWTTENIELNCWIAQHIDEPAQALLGTFPHAVRLKTGIAVMERFLQGAVRVPSPYLCSILRRTPPQPYVAGGRQRADAIGAADRRGVAIPAPGAPRPPPPVDDSTAAPVTSAAPSPPPRWVAAAWSVRHQKTQFMRHIAGALCRDARQAMTELPGELQIIACQMMLLNSLFYMAPVPFFRNVKDGMETLEKMCMPAAISSGASSSSAGPCNLVIVHFGETSGFEMMAWFLSLNKLWKDGVTTQVLDRVLCGHPPPHQEVVTLMGNRQQGVTKPVIATVPAHIDDVIATHAPTWKAKGARVLLSITVPTVRHFFWDETADRNGGQAVVDNVLQVYLQAAKKLMDMIPNSIPVLFVPQAVAALQGDIVQSAFGPRFIVPPTILRVPQPAWDVHLAVSASPAPMLVQRMLGARPEGNHLHPSLLAAWNAAELYDVVLPNATVINKHLDDLSDAGQVLREDDDVLGRLILRREGVTDGALQMLSRDDLATVFGLRGWSAIDMWCEGLPCHGFINSATGLECAERAKEASPCGQPRWCANCCELYSVFVDQPTVHVMQTAFSAALAHGFNQNIANSSVQNVRVAVP